jgi:hypothetical protein
MRASRRTLMVLRMALAMGTAKWSSYMAGTLGDRTETTWPRLMPSDEIDEATRWKGIFVTWTYQNDVVWMFPSTFMATTNGGG